MATSYLEHPKLDLNSELLEGSRTSTIAYHSLTSPIKSITRSKDLERATLFITEVVATYVSHFVCNWGIKRTAMAPCVMLSQFYSKF